MCGARRGVVPGRALGRRRTRQRMRDEFQKVAAKAPEPWAGERTAAAAAAVVVVVVDRLRAPWPT